MLEEQKRNRYSFIYNELVNGPDDFVGLVAYCLYKQDKIAYVKNFEKKHDRAPNPEELRDFHDFSRERLELYKESATNRVNDFYKDVLMAYREELEEQYQQQLVQELKCVRPLWWYGVFQSIAGSFIFAIFVGILVIILLYSQYGLDWVIKTLLKSVTITQ